MNLQQLIARADRAEAAALEQLTRAAVACEASIEAHERATKACNDSREKIAAAYQSAVAVTKALALHMDSNPHSPRMLEIYQEQTARAQRSEHRQQTIDQLMINAPFQN